MFAVGVYAGIYIDQNYQVCYLHSEILLQCSYFSTVTKQHDRQDKPVYWCKRSTMFLLCRLIWFGGSSKDGGQSVIFPGWTKCFEVPFGALTLLVGRYERH